MNNLNRKIISCKTLHNTSLAIACSMLLGTGGVAIESVSAQTKYNRFADYCLNFYELPEETKVVVQNLISAEVEYWVNVVDTDKCYAAEQELTNIEDKKLQLSIVEPDLILDLTPLTTIDQSITEIRANLQHVRDITPLAGFTNLELLEIETSNIKDISPLSSLTNIRELDLRGNLISDLSPLSSLTNLETLDLTKQGQGSPESLRELSPLSSLSSLRELKLSSNNIADVSPLSSLTRLEILHLRGNQITDISSLSSLSSLTQLWLGGNYIAPENRVCPIDVVTVCNFGSQRPIAKNTNVDDNSQQALPPQNGTQPNTNNRSQNPPPNNDSGNQPEPTENNDIIEETIKDASEGVLDSIF